MIDREWTHLCPLPHWEVSEMGKHYFLISYEEAQELLPFLENFMRETGLPKKVALSLRGLKEELEGVGDVDWSPLPGKQLVLDKDEAYILQVLRAFRNRGLIPLDYSED